MFLSIYTFTHPIDVAVKQKKRPPTKTTTTKRLVTSHTNKVKKKKKEKTPSTTRANKLNNRFPLQQGSLCQQRRESISVTTANRKLSLTPFCRVLWTREYILERLQREIPEPFRKREGKKEPETPGE